MKMNSFEKIIKEKTDEELIMILSRSQDYQPEFIELVKKELQEVRNIKSCEDFLREKSDEELTDYFLQSKKYSLDFVKLVKNEINERNIFIDVELEKEEEKIHGWLTFFLVMIGLGSILSVILNFKYISIDNYNWEFSNEGFNYWMAIIGVLCEMIFVVGFSILGIITIMSFYKYKPNAVTLGKSYFIIAFCSNLFVLAVGEFEPTGLNTLSKILSRLIFQAIGFLYLSYSEQVISLFPEKKRVMYKRDKIFLSSIVAPMAIWFLFSFGVGIYERIKEDRFYDKYFINENVLSVNVYTDGLIIFEQPEGLFLEKHETDGDVYYILHNEAVSITIYSTFDDTDTQEFFEDIMADWADEDFEDFDYDIVDYQHLILNDNSVYLITFIYHSEPVVEWSFMMMFNKETSKCCIISYFSTVETNYLEELIYSIRFK